MYPGLTPPSTHLSNGILSFFYVNQALLGASHNSFAGLSSTRFDLLLQLDADVFID